MTRRSRRELLEETLWAAAAASFAPAARAVAGEADGPPAGPNDTVRVAVCGVKGRGGNHVDEWLARKDVRVVAICDVDPNVTGEVAKKIEKAQGAAPRYEKDLRRLLDDTSIDAVSVATTNHTHTLLSLWAVQAGKHVYVEKPLSHNVWEGRKLVEAARKYNRCVQHGTQRRSEADWRRAIAFLRGGGLGKVTLARSLCYCRRKSIGKIPDGPAPAGVDYDLWLGPAPVRPFNRNRFHYNWHWFWDYGNGDIGNNGVHFTDIALCGLGVERHPKQVECIGGRLGHEDDGETANTQLASFDYGDARLLIEVRGLDTKDYRGQQVGLVFHCEKGYLAGTKAFDLDGKPVPVDAPDDGRATGPFRNFIDAVKKGDPKALNADVLLGHYSSAVCHLANVSYRLGTPAPLDAKDPPFAGDDAGREAFGRMVEHLKENDLDPAKTVIRRGPALAFDDATERFVGNPEADKLLTREYRKPFVVPETV
jgi:predicted dehydrogenase